MICSAFGLCDMAIEKNNFKVSRFDSEFSPGSRESMSSDEDELQRRSSAVDSDDDDEFDDADSGAGSDDFDLLELGETGAEFCQVGNITCSVPFELYDLPGLGDILSVDVWNECLSEEERFSLTKYLPDMEQDTFMRTLKELFEGNNFHFDSPIKKLFDMLKGGLCEPRVALYREGLNFFQRKQHYHLLRKHQNDAVSNFCQIRDAWMSCRGYSIQEKLRVLNIMKNQKSLMNEKMEDFEIDSSEGEESIDGMWSRRNKDRKSAKKSGRYSAYGVDSNLEFASQGQSMALETARYMKQNPKGILKTAGSKIPSAKDFVGHVPLAFTGLDMDSGPYSSSVPHPRQKYDSGPALRMRDRMRTDDDVENPLFGMGVKRNAVRGAAEKHRGLRVGKKHEFFRDEELASDSLVGLPVSSKNDSKARGRNRNTNLLPEVKMYGTKAPNLRTMYDVVKKGKYPENVQKFGVGDPMKTLRGRGLQPPVRGSLVDLSDRSELYRHGKIPGDAFSMDSSFKPEDWNNRSKKWKSGRESPDLSFKSYKASSPQMSDRFLNTEFRVKSSQENIRGNFVQNGGPDMTASKGSRIFRKGEDTESDSSEQYDDEDSKPSAMSKFSYPSGGTDGSRFPLLKSGRDAKKARSVKKDMQENEWGMDEIMYSKKMGKFAENAYIPGIESYAVKAKKGKMRDSSPLHDLAARIVDDGSLSGMGNFEEDDRRQSYKSGKNGQLRGEPGERLQRSLAKSVQRKQKGVEKEDDSLETRLMAEDSSLSKLGRKAQRIEAIANDLREKSEASLLGCNSVTKKRKAKDDMREVEGREEDSNLKSILQQQIVDSTSTKKKGKKKVEASAVSPKNETSEPPAAEMGTIDMEIETKPQKNPFTLITPTVHTGFSFSIIHLLSAVRMAMISTLPEDSLEIGKPREEHNRKHEGGINGVASADNIDANNSDHAGQVNLPSLTIQEIVNRVRSNPGDPCILEAQEPLLDLVRGVLKIFSSKTAPLGAKGWKALVIYEKSTKCWSWIGPVSHISSDHETIEEVTSPEAWILPHKMLVKLVDSFANWLKSGQETLQQIGSLPAPPISLMQCNLDEKERFRDLRAQKSLNTISPSSEEVRDYFRKEEVLRYSIPDRAFCYTAADGKKSIVAPLRRCGGKPTSKARDHFMLKRNRPPHVTILCLVRDAAARLPGSIGTRADVCTLIRDSQYIVEEVSDAQVNQVVSGALDRLHYERDPCVQFDGERKLWVYLHREREEEDFEDDGTSSTKKWKRQKKDAAEQSEQGAVTVAFHGTVDESRFDLGSDLNAEPACIDDDKRAELLYNDVRQNAEENVDSSHGSEQGITHEDQPMAWDSIGLNPARENKLLCQENSTNEDFDDEAFTRERPVEMLSAGLL